MAFLRAEKKKSGTYLRIIESYRDSDGKKCHRSLYSLGKKENYTSSQLENIAKKLYELGGGNLKDLLETSQEIARYNYGYFQVFSKSLSHFGLDKLFSRISRKHRLSFDLSNAISLMLLERLQDPCSKRQSFFNQNEYYGLTPVKLQHLYRSLDRLAEESKTIQQQIYLTGRNLFNQELDVVFYDVTTLYFNSEIEQEGSIRQKGFSKDGKIGCTQILFCMLVDKNKQPIGYQIFQGDTFEGHTFEKAVSDLKKRYQIDKVIVVADRGMLSKHNIKVTTSKGFEFIVGERIRKLPQPILDQVLELKNYQHTWVYSDAKGKEVIIRYTIIKHENKKIIVTYSSKRAEKDKIERNKKLLTAEKLLKTPSLINKKASRFYLKETEKGAYLKNEEKIKRDEKFDGFLAVSTNNESLTTKQLLEQYKQLYKIEQSFRTFKSHLEIRPMFHWTNKRIEGHICLCYIAFAMLNYTLLKLEKAGVKTTEKQLQKTIDKMQFSLVKQGEKETYLRSTQSKEQVLIQQKLGLKILPSVIKKEEITQYI